MGANGIYGLSGSGLDIDSMVKVGMLKKQNTYDKMYQEQTKNTWIKSAYAEVYAEVNTFKEAMSTFNKQSTMSAMTALSNNGSTVTATANGAAAAMTHKVQVESLSTNAYLLTKDTISRASDAESSYQLSDVIFKDVKSNSDGSYSVCKADKEIDDPAAVKKISYQGEDYTAAEVITAEGADKGKIQLTGASGTIIISQEEFTGNAAVTLDDNGDKVAKGISINDDKISYTVAGDYTKVKADDKAISFKISNGSEEKEISYTYADLMENTKTLYDLATDIGGSGLNITAKYDATTDSFSMYNNTGGKDNKISITATNEETAKLFNSLGLASTDGETMGEVLNFKKDEAQGAEGQSGCVKIDGKTYNNLTGNSLSVAGVTYTFNNVSDYSLDDKGNKVYKSTTISVSQDTDSIIDSVKSFVDTYNTLIDSLQAKYSETQYKDYKPLTKNQEAQMTESQIKQWNEKAKSGMLYHSSELRSLISDMREALVSVVGSVDSKYNSASALGITTSNNKGHITLDEDKLKTALADDPDCVYQVFGSLKYDSKDNLDTANTGIANRMYFKVTNNSLKKIKDLAGTTEETDDGSYYGNLITNMLTKMSTFKTQMSAYEKLLYSRYDKMETALSKLGTQMSYITGGQ